MKITVQKIIKYPEIVNLFLNYPDRNFTPLEISRITKTPYTTTWRYVQSLEKAGVIFIERIGEYNVCKLNKSSPLLEELKSFLKLELSPHWLAINEFLKKVKGLRHIQKIILFGSVAKGVEKLTSDIDIAVMVDKKDVKLEDKISDIVSDLAEKSKMVIVPLILSKNELKDNKQFTTELKKGKILYERSK
jgi:predicted nucleotidyltransferase